MFTLPKLHLTAQNSMSIFVHSVNNRVEVKEQVITTPFSRFSKTEMSNVQNEYPFYLWGKVIANTTNATINNIESMSLTFTHTYNNDRFFQLRTIYSNTSFNSDYQAGWTVFTLNEKMEMNLAYISFPDTYSAETGWGIDDSKILIEFNITSTWNSYITEISSSNMTIIIRWKE